MTLSAMQVTLVAMAIDITLSTNADDLSANARIDGLQIASGLDKGEFLLEVQRAMIGRADVRKYISIGYAKKVAWRQYWRTFGAGLRAQVQTAPDALRGAVAMVASEEWRAARAASNSTGNKSQARHKNAVIVARDETIGTTLDNGKDTYRAVTGETPDGKGNGNNRWSIGTFTPSSESMWFAWMTVVTRTTVTVSSEGWGVSYTAPILKGTDGKSRPVGAARRAHMFMAWVEGSLGDDAALTYLKMGLDRRYYVGISAAEIDTFLDACSGNGMNAYKWFRVGKEVVEFDAQD